MNRLENFDRAIVINLSQLYVDLHIFLIMFDQLLILQKKNSIVVRLKKFIVSAIQSLTLRNYVNMYLAALYSQINLPKLNKRCFC